MPTYPEFDDVPNVIRDNLESVDKKMTMLRELGDAGWWAKQWPDFVV